MNNLMAESKYLHSVYFLLVWLEREGSHFIVGRLDSGIEERLRLAKVCVYIRSSGKPMMMMRR